MNHDSPSPSHRGWLLLLLAAPLAAVVLWWVAAGDGGATPLVFLALAVPVLVVFVPLVLIAREVASEPDDPEEVEGRLAASLGLTKAEFDARFADEPLAWDEEE